MIGKGKKTENVLWFSLYSSWSWSHFDMHVVLGDCLQICSFNIPFLKLSVT